jgi:hypothetical protein
MKNNLRISYILGIFWLIVFAGTLLLGIANTIKRGFQNSFMFYILAALALLLFLLRRSLRLKEKQD